MRRKRAPRLDAERREAQERVQKESAQIHQLEARLAALKQLQESVQTEGKIQPWLDKHELGALPRLWKKLHVEAGWEAALESVLRERLAALEVSNLDWVKAFATDAPPAKLAFYSPPAAGKPVRDAARACARCCRSCVSTIRACAPCSTNGSPRLSSPTISRRRWPRAISCRKAPRSS